MVANIPLAQLPFLLNLDAAPYYNHDMFPNRMYRRLHARHHDPLDMHTLGLMARLGAHAHHKHDGELAPLGNKSSKDLFEVHLDVGLFQPEELSVKVVDGCVIVEGKHEEREDDHGYISRHFVRRYDLPKDYNPEKIVSTLSADGVLTVRAPKPPKQESGAEYVVPIVHTGGAALFLHNDKKDEKKNGTTTAEEQK